MRLVPGLLLPLVLVGLWSCTAADALVPREDLFSLSYGKLEHQVDLFQYGNFRTNAHNQLYMRGGIFSLLNGNGGKVMELSSYGDLTALYYNNQLNPRPLLLSDANSQRKSRVAVSFDFQDPGNLVVLNNGMLLVDDKSPDSQSVVDSDLGTTRDRVVLRFAPDRRLQDYLGQEGVGGSPFPFIDSIQSTIQDDVVVVSKTMESWLVHWFDSSGRRRFYTRIDLDRLPIPELGNWQPTVRTIVADPLYYTIHVHIDFYSLDDATRPVESRIYQARLDQGVWDNSVALPRLTYDLSAMESQNLERPPQSLWQFLGMAGSGHYFLVGRTNLERHELIILDRRGRLVRRAFLEIPDPAAWMSDLHLSQEGIISGMFARQDRLEVNWWRTDRLLGTGAFR